MKRFTLISSLFGILLGTDYYVSPIGNNNNSGTLAHPFKTIQKAADIVEAGDVVNIMGGAYHEQVYLDNVDGSEGMPIIFRSYDGERVVMDGTKPIGSTWEIHDGNIWKTQIDFDIWQLFMNRKEQVMARWPNANFDDGSIWD